MARRVRDLERFEQIVSTVLRKEAGYLADQFNLLGVLGRTERLRAKSQNRPGPETLRKTLEELGTVWIKFGQILSERPDMVPERYVRELKKLQDSVPEFSPEKAERIVDEEVGMEHFTGFEREPIAAASIAQVHGATLETGEEVVVKVRRPGIADQVETDLEILEYLAAEAGKHSERARQLKAEQMVKEFSRWTRNELDLEQEARNAREFREANSDRDGVYVPEVYPELTTEKVLVMERAEGVKCDELEQLEREQIDVKQLSSRVIEASLKQSVVDGFFHADPHPSNFLIREDGTFIYLDFGMMGRMSRESRNQQALLLLSIIEEDIEGAVSSLEAMGYQEDGYNREKVKEIVERYTMRMKGHSISEVSVSRTMFQMVTEASEHGLHMPNRVALVGKSLITMEGIGMEIYPDFQVDGAYRETLVEVLFKNNRPENLVSRLGSDVIRNKEMFEKAPSAIRRALEPREQEITVQTGKESGEHVVPAALILGSTLLLYQVLPPGAMAAAALAMLAATVYFLR